MAAIPITLNGINVVFGTGINNNVHVNLLEAMKFCIVQDVGDGYWVKKIYISAVTDHHATKPLSRHNSQKAVDISRINDVKISVGYPVNLETKAIVDGIQKAFESFWTRRENFGPLFCKKHGNLFGDASLIAEHKSHIHLSVD